MKKIAIIISIFLVVFLIYLKFLDRKVFYLAMGDGLSLGLSDYGVKNVGYSDNLSTYLKNIGKLEKYVNISKEDMRITDIIEGINDNKKVNIDNTTRTIKYLLIKADIVTISVGINDLLLHLVSKEYIDDRIYLYIDELMIDISKMLEIIKKYCKEDIILIGPYNPYKNNYDDVFKYLNKRYEEIAKKYNVNYLNTYEIMNEKYFSKYSIYPNLEGHKQISDAIIDKFYRKLK